MDPISTITAETRLMPALRMYPPVQPDRRDGWKLTRRGQIVAKVFSGAAILAAAMAVDPITHSAVAGLVALGQMVGAL